MKILTFSLYKNNNLHLKAPLSAAADSSAACLRPRRLPRDEVTARCFQSLKELPARSGEVLVFCLLPEKKACSCLMCQWIIHALAFSFSIVCCFWKYSSLELKSNSSKTKKLKVHTVLLNVFPHNTPITDMSVFKTCGCNVSLMVFITIQEYIFSTHG